MQSARRLLLPLANRTHHSLLCKEWEPYGSENRNEKAPKPQKLRCKHFYALAYAPPGKPVKKSEPNILTRCVGQKPILSAKPSPLPRVTALPRRRKEHTPYSAVSASGIRTPFLCTRANSPCEPCSCMPIFCFG